MMFWRTRERSVPVEKDGKIAPGSLSHGGKVIATDQSTYDSQMQSLKENLKIYNSERNEFSSNISSKSDMTNDTDFSVKTAIFNHATHASTTDTDEDACIEENQYLDIPEGITRRPFQPLPAIFDMVKSIPSCLRTMNYYQRKAARLQPRYAHPTSPMIHSPDNKLKRLTAPVAQGGKVQPNLFSTIFRGSVAGVPPTSPQNRLSLSLENAMQENRSGISWADMLSPSAKSGVLNHYQNRFQPVLDKNLGLHLEQKQRRITSFQQKKCFEDSMSSQTPLPSSYGDPEVNVTTQYFYSPRTPFSSPLRKTTDPCLEVNEGASGLSLNMKTVSTPFVTFATSQPSEVFRPASAMKLI